MQILAHPHVCNSMRRLFIIGLIFSCVIGFAQKIESGMQLPVRILNPVSSDVGGTVSAIVDTDIYNEGQLVISRGTSVEISVWRKESGMAGRRGILKLYAVGTTSVDGNHIVLSGYHKVKGRSRRAAALIPGVGLGLFIWPCMACLIISGGSAEVPANTILPNVSVAYPVNQIRR